MHGGLRVRSHSLNVVGRPIRGLDQTSPAMPMPTPLMTVRCFFIGSIVAMGGTEKHTRGRPFRAAHA